jgi:hypothetical protein
VFVFLADDLQEAGTVPDEDEDEATEVARLVNVACDRYVGAAGSIGDGGDFGSV